MDPMLEEIYLNSKCAFKEREISFFEEFTLVKDTFGRSVLPKAYMNKLILPSFICDLLFRNQIHRLSDEMLGSMILKMSMFLK